MVFTRSNLHKISDSMMKLPEKGVINNKLLESRDRCKICQIVKLLNNLLANRVSQFSNFNNWTFNKIKTPLNKMECLQVKAVVKICKEISSRKGLQQQGSLKMDNHNNNHLLLMEWWIIIQLIKIIDSSYTNNRNNLENNQITHNKFNSLKIIIHEWEWE